MQLAPPSSPPTAAETAAGIARRWSAAILIAILVIAAGLRGVGLGEPSLWYDEVVTMRLARAPGPVAMLGLLKQIDATRAPLHPLLLQGWLRVFGPSDLAARSLSALFGLLTVAVVFRIGREVFNTPTGLWSAWLCAVSPVLVRYSREVRMYALLGLLTCLAWALLFSFRRSASKAKQALFTMALVALFFTHPLGAFMILALGLAFVVNRSALRLSMRSWLATQGIAALAIVPWLVQYTNHPPEYLVGKLSVRFLIGMPIEFIGGNSRVLIGTAALIIFGLSRFPAKPARVGWSSWLGRVRLDDPVTASSLLIWFAVPPGLLYAYSRIFDPIFGPSRYTVFVAPAYLILVARGLTRLPTIPRVATAIVGGVLSGLMLGAMVYDPDLRADWRAVAAFIDREDPRPRVIILSVESGAADFEAVTTRYYFGPKAVVIASADELTRFEQSPLADREIWIVRGVGLRAGERIIPEIVNRRYQTTGTWRFPGLQLIRKSQ